MRSKSNEAAHLGQQAAPQPKRQIKSYKSSRIKSRVNLKTSLGELLWIVECSGEGKVEAKVWEGLERLMFRYIGIVRKGASNDRKTG